jgi:hypothetical protein
MKPAVIILAVQPLPREKIEPILWGLEEEGVPAELYKVEQGKAEILAKQAAERSALNVGIGINLHDSIVALHHRNLPIDGPLFTLSSVGLQAATLRVLGTNAARLVKGEPFVLQDKLPT